jgi:hypothetical protein
MKLSQILKYSGIVVGALGTISLVYQLFSLIVSHYGTLIVIGLGALSYFIGKWFAKQGK